jgi:hypothetical protein
MFDAESIVKQIVNRWGLLWGEFSGWSLGVSRDSFSMD